MFVLVYVFAICVANLSASYFGLWVTPINAFVLIGLELVVRDILHHKLSKLQMMFVVVAAGILSFLINSNAINVAIASFFAITISCFVDYVVYSRVDGAWIKKSNTSNLFSGFTDSIIFPLIAFGVFIPEIFALQWSAKVFGGFIWTVFLHKLVGRSISNP